MAKKETRKAGLTTKKSAIYTETTSNKKSGKLGLSPKSKSSTKKRAPKKPLTIKMDDVKENELIFRNRPRPADEQLIFRNRPGDRVGKRKQLVFRNRAEAIDEQLVFRNRADEGRKLIFRNTSDAGERLGERLNEALEAKARSQAVTQKYIEEVMAEAEDRMKNAPLSDPTIKLKDGTVLGGVEPGSEASLLAEEAQSGPPKASTTPKGTGSSATTNRSGAVRASRAGTQTGTQAGTQVGTQAGTQAGTQTGTQAGKRVRRQLGSKGRRVLGVGKWSKAGAAAKNLAKPSTLQRLITGATTGVGGKALAGLALAALAYEGVNALRDVTSSRTQGDRDADLEGVEAEAGYTDLARQEDEAMEEMRLGRDAQRREMFAGVADRQNQMELQKMVQRSQRILQQSQEFGVPSLREILLQQGIE